ncbi:MAG: hypothetical protein IPK07_26435 [Deltaproteobacteria bacterium]|nr:hypothetical protein [Deltaproteobacteria bacterium]
MASARAHIAEWRHLSPAERRSLARACSRDVIWAVSLNRNPQRILDQVDPLPESSERALARLRRLAGWSGAHP